MKGWIFDMDGTLTVPQHDFAALRRDLGLPAELDILAGIAAAPADEQPGLHEAVRRWEEEHADRAQADPGAVALLDALEGRKVGVLTRNTRENALRTLSAISLLDRFDPVDVLGRDCAAPKPDPAGVLLLAKRWALPPTDLVMIGDWIHDVEAGRRAGATTIWIDPENTRRFEADLVVPALHAGLVSLR